RLEIEWAELAELPPAAAPEAAVAAVVRDKLLRDCSRAWAHVLADLLAALTMHVPDAARIEHDLAGGARIAEHTTAAQEGNTALAVFLATSERGVLAATLRAALRLLRCARDTAALRRVLTPLAALAPSLALLALLPQYTAPTPAQASTQTAYQARLAPAALGQPPDAGCAAFLGAWLADEYCAALVHVCRDAYHVDAHDAVLHALADLAYYSAALHARMPAAWAGRQGAEHVDPGLALRRALAQSVCRLGQLNTHNDGGDAGEAVLRAFEECAAEADGRRRRAVLRLAMAPMLAVEQSRMFGTSKDAAKAVRKLLNAETRDTEGGLARDAPAAWTNRSAGQSHALVDSEDFDLAAVMP
ncbi:hypothetical protein LPJ73_003989, partial [Coemansia sp. RSA 2703]